MVFKILNIESNKLNCPFDLELLHTIAMDYAYTYYSS